MNTQLAVSAPPLAHLPERQLQRLTLARELAKSRNIPPGFANSPADIYMVLEVCEHSNLLFPLAIWDCSLIKGRIMWGGKICAAMLHNSGRLAERLKWTYSGEGDNLTCTVTARLQGEGEPRSVSAVLKNARTPNNANWVNDPEQQLAYFTTRKWGRLHLPEVLMGAVFEGETIDVTPTVITTRDRAQPMVGNTPVNQMTDEQLDREIERASKPSADAVTEASQPFEIMRADDSAETWSQWAQLLMAYVRASPTADIINEWITANADHLAALQKYDSNKYRRLVDMVNHQIATRAEADAS